MRFGLLGPGVALVLVAALAGACIANAPEGIERITDGQGGQGAGFGNANSSSSTGGPLSNDPHQIISADPPHGPFTGGQKVLVHGKGFDSEVRVWFGEVEGSGIVPVNGGTFQVNAPPGEPGPVDLTVQNGDDESTRRTLIAGYSYDALYAVPDSGPVSGGTLIQIFGKGTSWDADVDARIDQEPCTTVEVVAPDELNCLVPQGTPGAKAISVAHDGVTLSALDAYTYVDSTDGFKGGLSGDPLAGQLKVLVFNNFTGDAIPAAHVVVGTDLAGGLYQQTDSNGVTVFDDDLLLDPQTVTVAAECHSPISFVDVPVDTVTVYLDPVLTPACAGNGEPPPGGGNPVLAGIIEGELVWPSTQEFQKGVWNNVPAAGANEVRIAYLFFATRDPSKDFVLPTSTFAVNESSPGSVGYGFQIYSAPGNQNLYALAGLLNNATGAFTAYSMGVVKGVTATPGGTTSDVFIAMETALDQALTLDVSPPPSGPKGPDRLHARVVVELAKSSYAILPNVEKNPLIPLTAPLSFVGVPPLDGDLTGARYISSAAAVTGPSFTAPLSAVQEIATTTTSVPVLMDGFPAVPVLLTPPQNGAWDGRHLEVSYTGGYPVDLTVYEVSAGGGLVRWIVAVPSASAAIELPDISGFEGAGLPTGPLVIGITGGRVEDFDYGSIGYRNLRPQGMIAYSLDYFDSHW